MSFTITHQNSKGFEEVIITNTTTQTSCAIIPEYGAALNGYFFANQQWVDGYNSWQEIEAAQYKGVVLAPFANRIVNGKYTFEGKSYQLPINRSKEQTAIHGLLYNKPFEIIDEEALEKEACVVLSHYYEGDVEGYPFEFQINITYTLHIDNTLEIETIITHDNEGNIPFSLGFHPYFKVSTSKISDAIITVPPCKEILVDSALIPTGKTKVFAASTQKVEGAKANFDTCYELTDSKNRTFILQDKLTKKSLKVSAENDKDFPFFLLHIPTSRQSVAIEPMTSTTNAFNSKNKLLLLQPDKTHSFVWKIKGE